MGPCQREAKQKKAREMWLACSTQQEIAEAVGVTRQSVDNWEEEFAKSCQGQEFANPVNFDVPIYNVWKQQVKTNSVSHFGNSEVEWLENLLYHHHHPAAGLAPGGGAAGAVELVFWLHHGREPGYQVTR